MLRSAMRRVKIASRPSVLQPTQIIQEQARGPLRAVRDVVDEAVGTVDGAWHRAPGAVKVITAPVVAALDAVKGVADTLMIERPEDKRRRRSTAMALAVEPNPGPPKRGGSRKGSRKASRKRRGSTKPARSNKKGKRGRGRPSRPIEQFGGRLTTGNFPGKDLVFSSAVVASPAPVTGQVVFACDINPSGGGALNQGSASGINGISLNYEAAKWENFDCDVTFEVRPLGNKNVSGTYTAGIEMDPTDAPPSGVEMVQRLLLQGGRDMTIAGGGRVGYSPQNRAKAQKLYYVNQPDTTPESRRQTSKGRFYLVINEPPKTFITTDTGTAVEVAVQVVAHYHFRFFNRTLEPVSNPALQKALSMAYQYTGSNSFDAGDPFGLYNWAAVAGPANKFALGLDGIVIGMTGAGDVGYIAIPAAVGVGLNYLAIAGLSAGTNTAVLINGTMLVGSIVAVQNPLTGGDAYYYLLGLSNDPAVATVPFAYRWDAASSTWVYLSDSYTSQFYLVARFSLTTSPPTFTNLVANIVGFPAAPSGFAERLLAGAGPATVAHAAMATWDGVSPFSAHIASHQKARQAIALMPPGLGLEAPARAGRRRVDIDLHDGPLEYKEVKEAGQRPSPGPATLRAQLRELVRGLGEPGEPEYEFPPPPNDSLTQLRAALEEGTRFARLAVTPSTTAP